MNTRTTHEPYFGQLLLHVRYGAARRAEDLVRGSTSSLDATLAAVYYVGGTRAHAHAMRDVARARAHARTRRALRDAVGRANALLGVDGLAGYLANVGVAGPLPLAALRLVCAATREHSPHCSDIAHTYPACVASPHAPRRRRRSCCCGCHCRCRCCRCCRCCRRRCCCRRCALPPHR